MAAIGRIFKGTWVDLPMDKGARMDGKGASLFWEFDDGVVAVVVAALNTGDGVLLVDGVLSVSEADFLGDLAADVIGLDLEN